MKEFKIFIDMDGVLTDFETQFKNIKNNKKKLSFDNYKNKFGLSKTWNLIDKESYEWWSDMLWTKDGKKLWNYFKQYDPIILSSPSRSKDSIIGKAKWIRTNLNIEQWTPTLSPKLTRWDNKSRMIFSGEKFLFSNRYKNSILIDDRKKNIELWKKKGGIGILHKNTENTITIFEKIIHRLK